MIAVIETVTGGLSHEMFNAGMLFQLQKVYPDEKIVYFCEKEQAKYVKRILEKSQCEKIKYYTIERIYADFNKEEIKENKGEYVNIFKKCLQAKFVMILSANPVNVGLIKNIMKMFSYLKFGICIHGAIELILPQNCIRLENKWKLYSALKEYRNKKMEIDYFKRNLQEMAALPNCNIILYSDVYKKYKSDINDSLYRNITVLNLPYVFTYDRLSPESSKLFKIGIMPSSAAAQDQNCIKIIEYMNEQKAKLQYPYKFLIFNYNIGSYENVGYITKPGRMRQDVENFMKECDWMLIPYDEKKYILSSSGVMFDCIEAERPFFALGSYAFSKAIEAGCGIQESSIAALGEKIIQQINRKNEDYICYLENIRRYKKQIEEENLERLEKIFGA